MKRGHRSCLKRPWPRFHHSKSIDAPPFNHIHELQKECHEGIPYSVFLSGPPLEIGPSNFLGPLRYLSDPSVGTLSPIITHDVEVADL